MTTERFSASAASRHMACHASANLDVAIEGWHPPVEDPDKDNAANRGTMMHSLFAGVMGLTPREQKNFLLAIQYVVDLTAGRRFKKLIEEPVKAEWLSTRPGTTADLVLHTRDELHILDLKTGRTPVDPVNNVQLMFYALCYAPLAPAAKGATLHVIQPAADNITSWFADTATLQAFMQDAIAEHDAIQQGDVSFGVGDHCMFCPANPRGRGDKGTPYCPEIMQLYYPTHVDEAALLKGE